MYRIHIAYDVELNVDLIRMQLSQAQIRQLSYEANGWLVEKLQEREHRCLIYLNSVQTITFEFGLYDYIAMHLHDFSNQN